MLYSEKQLDYFRNRKEELVRILTEIKAGTFEELKEEELRFQQALGNAKPFLVEKGIDDEDSHRFFIIL